MQTHPSSMETWLPLIAAVFAFVSYGLHRWKEAPNAMTFWETVSNFAGFLVWRFIFFAGGLAMQFAIFTWVASLVPWKLPSNFGVMALSIFVADFCYYWKHRGEHDLSVLWAQHSVHHSSAEFNLSTSLRLPWVGSYLNWPFFIPALLLGFSAPQIIFGHQVVLAYQYLVHTEFVRKMGFFEAFLNTPSHHRVHHGRNPEYLDKNYGGILIIWDKIFGTFQPETVPVLYGTVHPMLSKNPFVINYRPWVELYQVARTRPTYWQRFKVLFTAPRNL
jgi:sterol desaturase/sphingolipid hydroxylase (fatty acid hydroxylase superfamily)